jgi:hypothetical protein
MATLTQDSKANYRARKRLPDDVRDDYGRLYGPRVEAKFFASASTKRHEAKQLFGEWLSEVESRISNIRAQRKGEGLASTRQQARALAGEWYDWFLARHSSSDKDWEQVLGQVQDALCGAVGEKRWNESHPDELWEQDEGLRQAVQPVLADLGETSQFLATKALVLNNDARNQFLDFLYKDLAAALKRLIRISEGDYSADNYRERFPNLQRANTGKTPWQLFEQWAAERKPAASTIESWRTVFRAMEAHFEGRDAASITADEAQAWIDKAVSDERRARTFERVFRWCERISTAAQANSNGAATRGAIYREANVSH